MEKERRRRNTRRVGLLLESSGSCRGWIGWKRENERGNGRIKFLAIKSERNTPSNS
jgi:hypothetical protein